MNYVMTIGKYSMKNLHSVIRQSMTAFIIVLLGGSVIPQVNALTLTHTVDATDNLYYSDWGHWFTQQRDGALAAYATGSTAASAVADASSTYNFVSWDYLDIVVTGSVTDAGTHKTGADGCPNQSDPCGFGDGKFRYQDVYSVIGLWSSSADSMTPILFNSIYKDWRDAVFLVGSNARIAVPKINNAYLFLADNDGNFSDNAGFYSVSINTGFYAAAITTPVSEPASGLLMLASLLGLYAIRRRR